MKQILNAFFFALSYFSIIPVFVKNMEITNGIMKQRKVFTPSTMEVKAFLKIKELESKQSLNEFEIITMVQLQDFIKTSYRSRLTQM